MTHFPEKWNTTCRRLDFLAKQRSLLAEFFTKCGKKDINNNDWENDRIASEYSRGFPKLNCSYLQRIQSYYTTTFGAMFVDF